MLCQHTNAETEHRRPAQPTSDCWDTWRRGGDCGIPRDDCEPGRQRTCSQAGQEFRPCLDVGPQDRRMWIKLAPPAPCVSTQPLVLRGHEACFSQTNILESHQRDPHGPKVGQDQPPGSGLEGLRNVGRMVAPDPPHRHPPARASYPTTTDKTDRSTHPDEPRSDTNDIIRTRSMRILTPTWVHALLRE